MATGSLTGYEQAVLQILISKGYVEDAALDTMMEALKPDFQSDPSVAGRKEAIFGRINAEIGKYALEIKTMVQTVDATELSPEQRVFYHVFTNVEEDFISKDFGVQLDVPQIKFFQDLVNHLVETKYASSQDIKALVFTPSTWNTVVLQHTLQKFSDMGYLRRDDRNFWELGPRSYVELRPLLEDAIRHVDDRTEEEIREVIADLPQVISY
jgi:Nse1 non-SMC component of SMC5-6 complex